MKKAAKETAEKVEKATKEVEKDTKLKAVEKAFWKDLVLELLGLSFVFLSAHVQFSLPSSSRLVQNKLE